MNLTIAEIKNLADFAGLTVDSSDIDEDEMDAEIAIYPCPKSGVIGDDDEKYYRYSGHIAYFAEYPEEGCLPLGEMIGELGDLKPVGGIEEDYVVECCQEKCSWSGLVSECVMLGEVGPLCPVCHEVTEPLNEVMTE